MYIIQYFRTCANLFNVSFIINTLRFKLHRRVLKSFYSSSFLNLGRIFLKLSMKVFYNEFTDNCIRCTFIFNKMKASEIWQYARLFFRTFCPWIWRGTERAFSYWIRRADKYRSQTNAYGASKFTDFHHIVLCDAFKHFCLISLMNWRVKICIFIWWNARLIFVFCTQLYLTQVLVKYLFRYWSPDQRYKVMIGFMQWISWTLKCLNALH